MNRFRPESVGFLLFFLVAGAVHAVPPHPVFAPHEDHGGEEGGPTGAATDPLGPNPCAGGFAGPYPCQNVDLLSFLPVNQMGTPVSRGSDIWGWTDSQTGREYALVALSDGAAFVDVTDPTRPQPVGFLPTQSGRSSGNRDLRVYKDHVYVVADAVGPHGMQVFDLRKLRGATGPQTLKADLVFTGIETVHNIDVNVDTGFAYLVGSNLCLGGLYVVDIRNPGNPVQAACHPDTGYIHDTQCVIYRGPDTRFTGREICFASNVKFFTILDVTDKANIRQISKTGYSGVAYCHQGWLTEDHAHFLMDDEGDERTGSHNTRTYLWDLSDLTAPRNFAKYDHPTRAVDHDQYIHQGLAYQGNYRAGLRILDVARVADGTLEEVGYFDVVPADDEPTFGGAWGAYPFLASGTVLVSGMESGLFLVRRSGQEKPGEPCKAGPQTLCFADQRFRVEVDWRNQFDGSAGRGKAVQGAFFTFGDSSNLELMVKVLDDGSHWKLYYGQLTNLGFTLRVVDTQTGRASSFTNGPDNCGGVADLAPSDGHGHSRAPVWLGPVSDEISLAPAFAKKKGSCRSGKDGLCLNGNRYLARVTWRNQFNGASGPGKPKPISGVTGAFAFTEPSNIELLVKVLSAGDGRTLVIWGAMSNLEYTLEVTDTKTGKVETYHNPAGRYCGGLDEL